MCWLISSLAFAVGFTVGGFAHALVAVVLWRKLIGNVIKGEVERVRQCSPSPLPESSSDASG